MTSLDAAAAPETAQSGRLVDLKYRLPSRYLISWGALFAVAILAAVFQPTTYGTLSIKLITGLAGCLLVASLGQNLAVMVGAVDLSVPALMTLSAAVNVHYLGSLGSTESFLLSVVLCVGISAVSGALISFLRLNALMVTLAMNAIVSAFVVLWLTQTFSTSGEAPGWLQSLGASSVFNVSGIFLLAVAVSAVTAGILSRTRPGRQVAAIGANRTAARILGTRVSLVGVVTFAGAGALYALAGALVAGLVHIPDSSLGDPYQLTTVTAVAIAGTAFAGGPSSISSLVAACLLLETFDQVLALHNLSAGSLDLVQGALLVVAVSLATVALYGRRGYKRLLDRFGSIRTRE
jgi:ribose transport system permease protein